MSSVRQFLKQILIYNIETKKESSQFYSRETSVVENCYFVTSCFVTPALGGRYLQQCRKCRVGADSIGKWRPTWSGVQGQTRMLLPGSCGRRAWSQWARTDCLWPMSCPSSKRRNSAFSLTASERSTSSGFADMCTFGRRVRSNSTSRVLLEKLLVPHLVKNFPVSYGPRKWRKFKFC